MLGFEKGSQFKRGITKADYNVDISGAETSFFIYCNIVQPQFVGNSLEQLLRTIPVTLGSLGTTVHKEFVTPHYIGVLTNEFDTIEVEIRNDFGTLIDFQFGKIIIKLHLRRKSFTQSLEMRVLYVPISDKAWLGHLQSGHGLGMYAGERYQRGHGFGAIFGPLLRTIMPIVKSVGKAVGKQALRSGAAVASDVLRGDNVMESLKMHGKTGVRQLTQKGLQEISQEGRGLGARPRQSQKTIKAVQMRKKRVTSKKRKLDVLGLY